MKMEQKIGSPSKFAIPKNSRPQMGKKGKDTIHALVRESKRLGCNVIKRSPGVAPEVNLRNPLHAGDEAGKQEIHPGFEILSRHHQKPKTGTSGPTERTYVPQKF